MSDLFTFEILFLFARVIVAILFPIILYIVLKKIASAPVKMRDHSEYGNFSAKHSRKYDSDYQVGIKFENQVYSCIGECNIVSIFHNVQLNQPNTQIDIIVVYDRGIIVIECKNWSGSILGNYSWNRWVLTKRFKPFGRYKHGIYLNTQEVYNPIKQNDFHISALNVSLKDLGLCEIKYKNLVVFNDCLEFQHITGYQNHDTFTIFEGLKSTICYLINLTSNDNKLSDIQLETINNFLISKSEKHKIL